MRLTTSSSRQHTTPDHWSGGPPDSRTAALGGLTTLGILAVAFGAMALGVPYFWVAFPVGFGGVLPLVFAYSRLTRGSNQSSSGHAPETETTGEPTREEALQALRGRYARGELTDEAFEARLERLLQTETVGEAREWVRRPAAHGDDTDDTDSVGTDGD